MPRLRALARRDSGRLLGPAGQLLDKALAAAGIERGDVYLTNAVKHFRHHLEPRGKRRIHDKPAVGHIVACHPWLEAELAVVKPAIVVCLGATAARSVLGRTARIEAERGKVMPPGQVNGNPNAAALITTHPSALLRLRGKQGWDEAFDAFVSDLETAAREVSSEREKGIR
ncbi:uracil-DNA glycosylase family protein [Leifsonia sp. NPDC058292]|uniref:uracil-DNA glycosylase family protein n=1 Tax=Leifsonia sp. NPDC058292 TaxID=3346428 RepID=UPI0036D94694